VFRFFFKWGLILVAIIVVFTTVTGTMKQIYWWMYP
jgi:hypothetical protein